VRGTAPAMKPSDIWGVLVASLTTGGSVGKLVADDIDAPISGAFPRIVSPSDDLLLANNSVKTHTGDVILTKKKESWVIAGGTYRITYELKCATGNAVDGKICVNDVEVGTKRDSVGSDWTEFTEDISGINVADLIQIWLQCGTAGFTAEVRNFHLKGTVVNVVGEGRDP